MKNIIMALVALFVMACAVNAQNNDQKWFISGGANGKLALNGSYNNEIGGVVSGGLWLNKVIGVRLSGTVGYNKLKNDMNATHYGARLDGMVGLIRDYGANAFFNLNTFVGISYNYYSMCNDFLGLKSTNSVTANVSLQPTFKLGSKWAAFIEPGIELSPKYYDVDNKNSKFCALTLSAGLIYKF